MKAAELRTQAKQAAFEAAFAAALSGEKSPQGTANKAYDQVMKKSERRRFCRSLPEAAA